MHDAVWALKKSIYKENRKVSSTFSEVAKKIEEVDQSGKLQVWYNLYPDLKDIGEIKFVACGLMMDIFELKKENLIDIVDEIAGVAYFTNEALYADKVLVIG